MTPRDIIHTTAIHNLRDIMHTTIYTDIITVPDPYKRGREDMAKETKEWANSNAMADNCYDARCLVVALSDLLYFLDV